MKRNETLIKVSDYGSGSVTVAAKLADQAASEFDLRHRTPAHLVGFERGADGSRSLVYSVEHDGQGFRRGLIAVDSR